MAGHPYWQSRWTFVAAASGLAIGLGNFWRLAWAAGEYGGGLYVATYLIGLAVIALPVLIAEMLIGHRGRGSPVFSLLQLRVDAGFAAGWYGLAPIAAVAALLLAASAMVLGSWLLLEAQVIASHRLTAASMEFIAQQFPGETLELAEARQWLAGFFGLCAVLLVFTNVVRLGIVLRTVIVLLVIMTAAAAYGAVEFGDMRGALSQLLAFRPDDFGIAAIVNALVQSLLTLGIGLTVITAYGAYAPEGKSIIWQCAWVVALDFAFAVMGALIIISVTVPHNIHAGGGYALLFISMPYVFANTGLGDIAGAFYFGLLTAVSATTVVALLEPALAWLTERWQMARAWAVVLVSIPLCVMADLILRGLLGEGDLLFWGMLPSDWVELIAAAVILPLVALALILALGWRVPLRIVRSEFSGFDLPFFWVWYPVMRYIVPPALVLVFIAGLWEFFQ